MTKADILVDELLQAALQAEAWFERVRSDPYIKRTEADWGKVLDSLALAPEDRERLESAESADVNAYTVAAFLYGLHTAHAVQLASREPLGVSEAILTRIEGR